MAVLFWLALLLVIYTYIGYPLVIVLLSRTRSLVDPVEPRDWPAVTIVVPFCNERHRVQPKLATLQALDYAGELQIIFVSDGKEDDTAEAVRRCASDGVEVVVLPARSGKPVALNAAIAVARHDLVLFTDARQMIDQGALRSLVTSMHGPEEGGRQEVGAVSGELVFVDKNKDEANVGLYWRYEKIIRQAESRYASVPGVTGAMYLIKTKYVRPLAEDALLDDFEMPLSVLRSGERVILDNSARVFDSPSEDVQKEKARKIRTLAGNFQAFSRNGWLFWPSSNPIWWQFISHKVLRLIVPYCLIALLIAPLFNFHGLYVAFWMAQAAFYLLAVGNLRGWVGCGKGLAAVARLFVELNLAAVIGAYRFLFGNVDARWERTA
tara:strand:+ start:90405 stop:91544 length:1140 start_codon:yes stop_codon:yes gene_type:complete